MAAVATASLAETPQQHVGVNRPNMVQVGTIVWLASELMFFAGLFAIYFTIRARAAGPVGERDRRSSTSRTPPSTRSTWC